MTGMAKPLSDAAMAAWARLIRAQQLAVAGVEDALQRAGYPPLVWYDVLLELERPPGDGLRQRDIQRHTLLRRYNVSRIVDRMEADGLVTRRPSPEDARGTVVRITSKGRALRRRMWPVYAAAIEENFAGRYGEKDLERLAALLAPFGR
jgi:DNA-binding MarR family transcriptional regulator